MLFGLLFRRVFRNFSDDLGEGGKVILTISANMSLKVSDEIDLGSKGTYRMFFVFEADRK